MRLRATGFCLALTAALPLAAQERAIDTQRSSITIHVGKAGLLSAAAHDHWVSARIASGSIDEAGLRVEFKVLSAAMIVKPDPKVDARTRDQIQKDMDETTLEIAKYPEIVFRSTHVSPAGASQFEVEGSLTLHGVSKPVSVAVKREGESFTGHTVIKQTDFGIKPISIGGGMIRIKDPVDIDFEIFARTP
ncbi:MAG: YceI family protein [Bryobacteraceae bacterium]|jgi:polyisoprenoid-binding protein YceI